MTIRQLLLISILLFTFSSVKAQELFINTPAAASISKGRLELRNTITGYDNFNYFHNSFEVNYGITGRLTSYNHIYYTTQKGFKFIGDIEPTLRYRFYDKDSRNFHLRFAGQAGFRIPIDSRPVVGDRVEYELHPGHVVKFFSSLNGITVPLIDLHATDNYTLRVGGISTLLIKRLALNVYGGYNHNIAQNSFKFGDYFDYGFSAGYLVFPAEYKSFDQVNLNLYIENKGYYFSKNQLEGRDVVNSGGFRLDTYLGAQFIFFSTLMVEGSYKIPTYSNEYVETIIEKRSPAIALSVRYYFFL